MDKINYSKCMSIKNKNNNNVQCPYNRKNGAEYCGIHCRSKTVIRIDTKCKIIQNDVPKVISTSIENNKSIIYTNTDMLINFSKIRKDNIINSLYHYGIIDNKKIKKSKRNLYIELFNHLKSIEEYSKYVNEIIIIQKYYRRYSIFSRSKSVNNCDLLRLESIFLLPSKYLYKHKSDCNKIFCFDVRYLKQLFEKEENPINPYTLKKFSDIEKTDILKRINSIKLEDKLNIELSDEKKLELKIISVFKKFNDLDNYTDPDWFFNLSFNKLKDLYIIAEDVWNYRAQLSESKKLKILNNSNAFLIKVDIIKKMVIDKHFNNLRALIISIFERFVTEGINRDEKKLGAMLMLTAMVEVSIDAANAMPYLIQVS